MDWYSTKRKLMRPVTAWRRRSAGSLDPLTAAAFEAHDYRPAMRRFFAASAADPDILIDVDLHPDSVVVDAGAYEGEYALRILDRADRLALPDLRIHAFEPGPGALDRLRDAVGAERRVEIHPFGLGARDRTEVLALGGPGSSVFKDPNTPGWFGEAEVELRDVDSVLTALGVDRIDLLKINIEGGEYELLDRLHETGRLARCGVVLIQFHEFVPHAQRARRRNRRQLAETHRQAWSFDWVFERWDPR